MTSFLKWAQGLVGESDKELSDGTAEEPGERPTGRETSVGEVRDKTGEDPNAATEESLPKAATPSGCDCGALWPTPLPLHSRMLL